MTAIPKSSQRYRRRPEAPIIALDVPEAALQQQADDYLEARQIRNIRVPDAFFRWLHMATTRLSAFGHWKWFAGVFGGLPDNLILLPIGGPYCLALSVEHKTAKGKLHGKQKNRSKEMGWIISRSPETFMAAVQEAEIMAGKLRGIVTGDTYPVSHTRPLPGQADGNPVAGLYKP